MKNEELLTTRCGGVDLVTTNPPDSVLHPLVANINIIYLTIINLTCDDRTSEMAPSKLDMTELRLVVVMSRHPSLDCCWGIMSSLYISHKKPDFNSPGISIPIFIQ